MYGFVKKRQWVSDPLMIFVFARIGNVMEVIRGNPDDVT